MKTAKFTLMFLACAAAIPAFAQNTTDSRCGTTNFDRSRNLYTITTPAAGDFTQQCFITVVPKDSWSGGSPTLASSQFVEGNYEVVLSGAGGGGGGGVAREGGGGYDGADAIPFRGTVYLSPGVYRVTIGAGGQGGHAGMRMHHGDREAHGDRGAHGYRGARADRGAYGDREAHGDRGADGGPTSLSDASSGRTIAGYPSAETWAGVYPQSVQVATGRRISGTDMGANMTRAARSGDFGGGGRGAGRHGFGDAGFAGGHGYLQLALKDPVPQPAPAVRPEPVTTPAPVEARPAKKDRN